MYELHYIASSSAHMFFFALLAELLELRREQQPRAFRVGMLVFPMAVATAMWQPFRSLSGAVESLASAREILATKGLASANILSIGSRDSLQKCVDIMREKNVGALVVKDSANPKEIAGIISERDIVKCMAGETPGHDNLNTLKHLGSYVQDYMTKAPNLKMVHSDTPLDESIGMMNKHNIRHLLVMTSAPSTDLCQLIGVMSMKDALNAILQGYMCTQCWFKEEELQTIQESRIQSLRPEQLR